MGEVWRKRVGGRAISLRHATKGDFDRINWVDATVRYKTAIPLLLSEELKTFIDSGNVLVAESQTAGRIIGFVIFEDIQYGCYIRRAMVLPLAPKGIALL